MWEFNFNDVQSGDIALNTGSDPNAADAVLTMSGSQDYRVQNGPSGKPDDYSFSTVKTGSVIPYAVVPAAEIDAISGYNKITVSGWYNITDPLPVGAAASFARTFLWGNRSAWSEGMVVDFNPQGGDSNKLGLEVNDYYSPHYGGDAYAPVDNTPGKWTFWAITYDGTLQTNNVKIYIGDTTDHTQLVGTETIGHNATTNPNGTIFNAGGDFVLGADSGSGYQNGMVGLQDNVRIFQGLIPVSDMDSLREADVIGTLAAGDMNGDGVVNQADASSFFEALTNPSQFAIDFPGIDPTKVGDMNSDGKFDFSDITPMFDTVNGVGAAHPALQSLAIVPEPISIGMLVLVPLIAMRRRNKK